MNISGSIQVHAVLLCLAFSELFNLAFSELLNLVFELEAEVSVTAQEEEDGDSPEEMCTISYLQLPLSQEQGSSIAAVTTTTTPCNGSIL